MLQENKCGIFRSTVKMLIHGRLIVTKNGLMLDEVKSLLQKSLRRREETLAFKAAKELIGEDKTQLKWQSIVTFMFEDHCLNNVVVFEKLFELYRRKDMLGSIELISRCYTCRHSACLQVTAIDHDNRNYEAFWDETLSVGSGLEGLVTEVDGGINFSLLLANVANRWREGDFDALVSLFGLINMAAKCEKRKLTKAGETILLDKGVKSPTLYHLVLSFLYQRTVDLYMKRLIEMCFRFSLIPDTRQGLIMFTVLSHLKYKDTVLNHPVTDTTVHKVDWRQIRKLDVMPDWAVDKHTYRGKFGKSSRNIFLKKFKHMELTEALLTEFHGERKKADLRTFFDVGCICKNDILSENPIWEKVQKMYLKQKPSLQKCSKMTKLYYDDLRKRNCIVMVQQRTGEGEKYQTEVRKRKNSPEKESAQTIKKRKVIEKMEAVPCDSSLHTALIASKPPDFKSEETRKLQPEGPLLQLPTGSGKVYTILDRKTKKVWKGPYKAKARQNLCVFYHKAMKEVFRDRHTMELEVKGQYVIFPLLKSKEAELSVTHRAFYDCISKRNIPEGEGRFVERDSLGLVQLHKLAAEDIGNLPISLWLHFAWRYILNIGDSGMYNAIATKDLVSVYGIDMEERRKQVKENNVMNMLFGKLPRKQILKEIERSLLTHVEEFHSELSKNIDFRTLQNLYKEFCLEDESEKCEKRLTSLIKAFENMCKSECGV